MEHWDNGVPVVVPLAGTPETQLRIDSSRSRLTLRAPVAQAIELPINTLAHVTIDTLAEHGTHFVEISTTSKELVFDGYAMLMAIADRIQLGGAEPVVAFEETLTIWEAILSARTRLGSRAEIGLVGELMVARSLLAGGQTDISAWRGGLGEEHDFGFAGADLEVKTTSGERRLHWISGLDQLVETPGGALWILSLQITRGGEGQGQTLPELIDEILALVGGPGRDRVEQNLAGAGWHEAQRDLYTERWRLRTAPLLLRVDAQFPRLTPALLSEVAIDTAPLRRVDYEIDLTDRDPSPAPPPALAEILAHIKGEA
jgi:Putative  PD-(D/E)XK family member, (DUF4420)